MKKYTGPKVLILDIETRPLTVEVWDIWDQKIFPEQIVDDWSMLSFAAKWLHDPEIFYADQKGVKDLKDDSKLLKKIWTLLDEADIVIGHNSKKFDVKKLNARFALNGMQEPSSYGQIDTKQIASSKFKFTSNSLAYLSNKLNKKHKKSEHKKFPGRELWTECARGNKEAYKELEKYNKKDVLCTEELYKIFRGWDNSLNFNLFTPEGAPTQCSCGSKILIKKGFAYTAKGMYQRYRCAKCGSQSKGGKNLLSKEKRSSLTSKV